MPDTDSQLLFEYVTNQSEDAFAELVKRHVDLVYSAALRQTRDPSFAEEATQVVFLTLAKKASRISEATVISGWLYRTTHYVCQDILKQHKRRIRRENESAMQPLDSSPDPDMWAELSPILDRAMGSLSSGDRDAILLRYFENRSLREVGSLLGLEERAAQKRVARALDRLRKIFQQHGVHLSVSAGATALSSYSIQAAPPGLSSTIILAEKSAVATVTAKPLIQGAWKFMALSKIKSATIVCVAMLVATTGTITLRPWEWEWRKPYSWQVARANSPQGLAALRNTPAKVMIVPSKVQASSRLGRLVDDVLPREEWRFIGIHESLIDIVKTAYGADRLPSSQIVVPSKPPSGWYDYIATLPKASDRALQELLKTKFGLTGRRELRNSDVLILGTDPKRAAQFKPSSVVTDGHESGLTLVTHGVAHYKNLTMVILARRLEEVLDVPVIDQTHLSGGFQVDLPEVIGDEAAERLQSAQEILSDLGLTLTAHRQLYEVFIIEKNN